MRVLITGADGFLGKKLLATLHEKYEIFGTSRREARENIMHLDITNKEEVRDVISTVAPNVLVHTAAFLDVDLAERERDLAYRVNVESTKNLAEICAEKGVKMIYFSSDYVFDGRKRLYLPSSITCPINFYGRTKRRGEIFVIRNPEGVVVRPTILYGFNDYQDRNNFVIRVIDDLRAGREVALDNERVKFPLLIDDVAIRITALIDEKYPGICHLSGPDAVTKYEWGKEIARVFELQEEKIISQKLEDTIRPQVVRFDKKAQAGMRSLREGLKLIKEQMDS